MADSNFDFFHFLKTRTSDAFVKQVLDHQMHVEGKENEVALEELKLFLSSAQSEIDRMQQETRYIPELNEHILGKVLFILPPGYFQVFLLPIVLTIFCSIMNMFCVCLLV